MSRTISSEPDPTDVIPTMKPPNTPMAMVRKGFMAIGTSLAPGGPLRRLASTVFTIIAVAATSSVTPRIVRIAPLTLAECPRWLMSAAPANADGIEPALLTPERAMPDGSRVG